MLSVTVSPCGDSILVSKETNLGRSAPKATAVRYPIQIGHAHRQLAQIRVVHAAPLLGGRLLRPQRIAIDGGLEEEALRRHLCIMQAYTLVRT